MNPSRFDLLIFSILFILSVGLIFFNQSIPVTKIHTVVATAASPVQIVLGELRNSYLFWSDAIINIRDLKQENQLLIQKNLDLESRNAALTSLEDENTLLKSQLGFARSTQRKLIGAEIISRDYQNSRSFIINQGTDNGLKTGFTVIGNGGNIVGQIVWVNSNVSQVRTIFDSATKISVITQSTRVTALVRGLGANLILDLVPKSQNLQSGELVVSSGQDGLWQKGLIIGQVTQVGYDSNRIFKTANLESLIDWSKLSEVFVIIPQ